MSRSIKVIKNAIWEMSYYVVVILLGFLAPRFIIIYYSSEVNGLSSTISQVINVLILLQAGATTTAIYSLYKPISNNNYEEICRNTAYAECFFKRIAWLFLAIMLCVSFAVPFFLKTGLEKKYVFVAFIIMGLKSFADLYFTAKFRVVFTAYQEKYYISIATMIEQLVYYALVFITIFFRLHFLLMYVWFFLGCIIKVIFLEIVFKRKHSNIVTYKYKSDRGKIGSKNYALANEVSHTVVGSSISIILSFMYGLKETSVYSVYALISQSLNLFAASIYSSFAPSFGDLVARDDKERASRVFTIFQYVYLMLNTFLMMCMLFLAVPFVELYTNGASDMNYANFELAFFLVLYGIFAAFRIPYNVIVSTCGFFKETWMQPVVCVVVSIIVSVLGGRIDYSFIILGPVVFYFINFVYQYYKLKQLVPWLINGKVFLMLMVTLLGILGVIGINRIVIVPAGVFAWITAAVIFSISVMLYLLIASYVFFKPELLSALKYMKRIILKR